MSNDDDHELRARLHAHLDRMIAEAKRAGETTDGMRQLDERIRVEVLALGEQVVRVAARSRAARVKRTKETPACEECDEPTVFRQLRDCRVRTCLTGEPVEADSAYAVCRRCAKGVVDLHHAMGAGADGFSERLREMAVLAGAADPFEHAADLLLQNLAGVHIGKTKVHGLCGDSNDAAWSLLAEGELGDARPLGQGEHLIIEIDGVMGHVDGGWHEVKLAVLYPDGDHVEVSPERNALLHRRVVATRGDREELGGLILNAAARFLPQDADGAPIIAGKVVVLGDGAPWIRNLVDEFLPGARVILDWYHAVQHLSAAARLAFADEGAKKRWLGHAKRLLRDGRSAPLLAEIARMTMKRSDQPDARAALQALHRYLSDRDDALGYHTARAAGVPIGSGAAESAANWFFQQRMKRPGMRWKHRGADAMLALRCAYASTGGFERLFEALRRSA